MQDKKARQLRWRETIEKEEIYDEDEQVTRAKIFIYSET